MNFLASYIMQGRMQAAMVASVLAMLSFILPPLGILSAAAVALVSLRNGQSEGILIMVVAVIAVGILSQVLFGDFVFAVGYTLGFWLPVWLVASVLRETGRLSVAFEVVLALGLIAIGMFYLFSDDPAIFWQQRLQMILQPMLDDPASSIEPDSLKQGLSVASHYMTGILVTGTVSTLILSLLVGRWWQANLYNPGGFRKEFLSVKPRSLVAYVCLGVFLIAIMGSGPLGEMMQNMSVLAFFLYLVVGTAVLHVLVSATKLKRLLLPALYVTVLLIPHAMLPVALVGFTDTWQNWRRRVIVDGSV